MASQEILDTKLIIKGLIASSPFPITLRDLNNDYAKEEGRPIPFKKFGFNSLLDFMQSITDTVRVEQSRRDPFNPIVSLVVSEKLEHVVSLVDRQTKKRKKPSRTYYRPPRFSSAPHYRPATPASSSYYTRPPYFHPNPRWQPLYEKQQQPKPPVVTKSHSSGLRPEGAPLLTQVVPLLTQVVAKAPTSEPVEWNSKRRNYGTPSYVSPELELKIIKIVKENPGISPKDLENAVHKGLGFEILKCYNGINEVLKCLHKELNVIEDKVYLNGVFDSIEYDREEKCLDSEQKMLLPCSVEAENALETTISGNFSAGFSSDDDDSTHLKSDTYSLCSGDQVDRESHISESLMSERLKHQLSKLLQKCPKGVWCWQLPQYYKNEYDIPLDCQQVGYVSVSQMMLSVPELFRCEFVDGMDCKVFDASQPIVSETAVSSNMIENIKNLLEKSRGGIDEDHFCSKFKMFFHTEFNFKNMGFTTLHSLFEALDGEVIHFVRIGNRYRICPLSQKESIGDFESLLPSLSKEFDEEFLKLFPKNVCGPMENINRVEFPKTAIRGAYLEVILAEISGPHNFWAQLRGTDYHIRLSKVMDEMEAFYSKPSSKKRYAVPGEAVINGLNCVAEYDGSPHRCRILKVGSQNKATIIYVDYGTITIVDKSDLLFLHRRFLDFPSQAFRCTLHNLKPANGSIKFHRFAGERLLQLVLNKGLVARIASIDVQAHTMSLILIDTSGKDDICINDVLVEERLAEYCCVDIDLAKEELSKALVIKNYEDRSPTPQISNIDGVIKHEAEMVHEMKPELEEQVLTRHPAAILSSRRRKVRTPPGFRSKEPPGFSNPPVEPVVRSKCGVTCSIASSPLELDSDSARELSGLSSLLGLNVDSLTGCRASPSLISPFGCHPDTGFSSREAPGLSSSVQYSTHRSVPPTSSLQQTSSSHYQDIDIANSSRYEDKLATTNVNDDLTYLLTAAVCNELRQQTALKQDQNTSASNTFREQYPNVPFTNYQLPSTIAYCPGPSQQANLGDPQTEYLQRLINQQAFVSPGYKINELSLNPLATPFVPPGFVPIQPAHQNPYQLPQNSYEHSFNHLSSTVPHLQQQVYQTPSSTQHGYQSSFDKFLNSPTPDHISQWIQQEIPSELLESKRPFFVPTSDSMSGTKCSKVRINAQEQYFDESSTLGDIPGRKMMEVGDVYCPQNASLGQTVMMNNPESEYSNTTWFSSQRHTSGSNKYGSEHLVNSGKKYSSSVPVKNDRLQSEPSSVVERNTSPTLPKRHTSLDNEVPATATRISHRGYQSPAESDSSVHSRDSSCSSFMKMEDRVPASGSSSVDLSNQVTENFDTLSSDLQEMSLDENSDKDHDMKLIRHIMVINKVLHVINVDGLWHLITDELLKIKDYKRNVAMKILMSKNVQLNFIELKQSSHESIFSELSRDSSVELKSGKLHVVQHDSVPKMLAELKYPENYIGAVQDEMEILLASS